jgi:hypothetical membrane protein
MRQQFKILLIISLSLAVIGVVQFLACTSVAMINFPGGFSFAKHYLSDLGRHTTEYYTTFNGSLIFLGFSLIPSFVMFWLINFNRMWSMRATTIFGVISACGLIGMGMASVDREFLVHYISLGLWLFPMIYMTVSFFFASARSQYVGVWFLSASLITVIAMIAILLQTELTSLQLLHKSVIFCGMIWLVYVIGFLYLAGRYLLKNWEVPHDLSDVEEAYFSTLVRDRRREP